MHDRIAKVLEHKGHVVETTGYFTTVNVAVAHMNERRIGSLVVVDAGRPTGIFTDRDVLVRVVARSLDPSLTLVCDVMTPDPITIRSDMRISDAMRLMTVERRRHLPVVDDGRMRGLISLGDLTSWMLRDQQRVIYDLHDYIRAA